MSLKEVKNIAMSPADLSVWMKGFSKKIKPQTLLVLSGPLGAGKTFFTQELLKALGGKQSASPTYSLIHEYELLDKTPLYHVDLYRLKDNEDLESTGFWDLFSNSDSIVVVEWGDRIPKREWPVDWQKYFIQIDYLQNNQRKYKID